MASPLDANGVPPTSGREPDPTLSDPWARHPLPLDGPMERTSVSPMTLGFVTGLLGLGAAFLLFQLLVTPVVLLAQIAMSDGGLEAMANLGNRNEVLGAYTRELIVSNSVGQVLALGGMALLMARLHSSQIREYLRLRRVNGRLLLLAAGGVIGLQPVVQWLAELNQMVPVPDGLRLLDESQLQLIRSVLESNLGLVFNLGMLSLVPGICEELLFRGYAQRQFERAAGPAVGVLLSGVLFGLYHFRPSQLLPLVVLGLYLAYLTWRTGSLWPAIFVHILHNGIAVGMAEVADRRSDLSVENLESLPLPWYVVLSGFVIVGAVLYVLHPLAGRLQRQ